MDMVYSVDDADGRAVGTELAISTRAEENQRTTDLWHGYHPEPSERDVSVIYINRLKCVDT